MKETKKYKIGGIQECMVLAIFLTILYLFLAVEFGIPLIKSNISEVFTTFFLGVPLSFIGISLVEIFWFERDLIWNGRKNNNIK